ncbi:MAG: hypothetical protein E7554_00525 [Ruminococcaceae bacterium]|nr:hypothetical protein [Oscillospiraceae bacterium]
MGSLYVDSKNLQTPCLQLQNLPAVIEDKIGELTTVQKALRRNSPIAGIVAKIPVYRLREHIRDLNAVARALSAIIEQYAGTENGIISNIGGSSGGSKGKDPSQMTYLEYLDYRRENAVDPRTRELYERYLSQIVINDDDYDGTAHYSPSNGYINYDADEDSTNPRGQGTTYYHEVGHLIDDRSDGNGFTSVDGKYEFYDKMQQDYDRWVERVMHENGFSTREQANEYISDWLWEDADNKNGISDIVYGLSEGDAGGKWGHDASYYNETSTSQEAFAHFFEAGMADDSTKLDYIKEVFPSAYEEYQRMLNDELN